MPSTHTAPEGLPRPLPLLGHGLRLMRDPWTFLTRIRPLGDVVEIRLGREPAYVVNSPDLIRRVLVTDARRYAKGVQFDKLRPVLGNGLVTSEGAEHLRNRRLVQPAFHHARIADYATVMRDLAEQTVVSWPDGAQLAVDRELTQLTLRIAAKTLFRTELGERAVDEVVRSMPVVLHGLVKRVTSPLPLLEKLPTRANRRYATANRRLREVVDDIIAEYRLTGADHGDVVSMLMLARDAETGEGLDDDQIRDEVLTLLMAGTETTANLLAWCLHTLGGRPDLEARLHAEVDEVLGDGPLTMAHIGRLEFTRRVVSETLRLLPPAWLISRRATQPVTLGDRELPAGASVFFSPYAVHRDPRLYADPETFDPDRWLPERAKEIARPSFLPFGAGNRQCIGEGFAWTEAIIVLATVARRWRLRPVPGVAVERIAGATLAPSRLPMVACRRAAGHRLVAATAAGARS